MFKIDNLTNAGNQTSTAILDDGTTIAFTFIYRAAIQRWTVDVVYGAFVARAIGLASGPNLLRLWRRVIPFGLQVSTPDQTDPFMADDLASGRVTLTVLDGTAGGTDVEDAEAAIAA